MQINLESIKDHIPYYLSQPAKDHLAKALDSFPKQVHYYTDRYPTEALQGDAWTSVDVVNFEDGTKKKIRAVLLSNSCDIDPANKRDFPTKLTFASMIRLSRFKERWEKAGLGKQQVRDKIKAITEQRVTSLVYFPKGASLEDDYVALLDDVHTVPSRIFETASERKKLLTLSNVGFYIFVLKLSVHFCRFHEEVARGPD